MRTLALFSYRPYKPPERTDDEWVTFKLVWRLKDRSFRGDARLTLPGGTTVRFKSDVDYEHLLGWISEYACLHFNGPDAPWSAPLLLIPVPANDALVGVSMPKPMRTLRLVKRLAADLNTQAVMRPWQRQQSYTVLDSLRWKKKVKKATDGGSRSADALEKLLHTAHVYAAHRVLLIDDVRTSGGHLEASRRVLAAAGADIVGALVVAQTVSEVDREPCKARFVDNT